MVLDRVINQCLSEASNKVMLQEVFLGGKHQGVSKHTYGLRRCLQTIHHRRSTGVAFRSKERNNTIMR